MRDGKMHHSNFFAFKHPHHVIFNKLFLAKPKLKINKPLLISGQTMHVMWQNIPWLVKEYFTTSWNILPRH
jgi:hypothetical protein